MKITITIKPNNDLIKKANEIIRFNIPVNRDEKYQYGMQLEEVLNQLLEHKNKFYTEALGKFFNDKRCCAYLCCCGSVPIDVVEDADIEEAITKLFDRKLEIYRQV